MFGDGRGISEAIGKNRRESADVFILHRDGYPSNHNNVKHFEASQILILCGPMPEETGQPNGSGNPNKHESKPNYSIM
jgi:hypothetical protein